MGYRVCPFCGTGTELDHCPMCVAPTWAQLQNAKHENERMRVVIEAARAKAKTWDKLCDCYNEFPLDEFPGACSEHQDADDAAMYELIYKLVELDKGGTDA